MHHYDDKNGNPHNQALVWASNRFLWSVLCFKHNTQEDEEAIARAWDVLTIVQARYVRYLEERKVYANAT